MQVDGKVPELALVVDIITGYFHCSKCIIRSNLWTADQAGASAGVDDLLLAQTMVKHGQLPVTVDQMHAIIVNDEDKRLY
jgi:uncharacterized protein